LFPSPKLAKYCSTYGNTQLWGYLGAEYGGGSWTMEEPILGHSERVDINDIRVYVGLDWQNLNRWYSFLEAGYVFNRQLYYVVNVPHRIDLKDTFMLRAGVSW
jgi:hypothetical protein